MKKRMLSLILMIALVLALLPAAGAAPADEFSDVSQNDWFYDAVNYAVENKLMNGVGGGIFAPNDPMTRAMLVTVLWRYEGSPEEGKNGFADIPDGQWFTKAVAWAAANGIVGGVGGNRFDPNGSITREQIAAIFYRYAKSKGIDTSKSGDLSRFPDNAEISSWAGQALAWTVAEGIIGGSNGKLLPQGNATRAQVATIFMRYIEDVVKAEPDPTEPTEAPTEPTEAPTEPTEAPTEPTEDPNVVSDFTVQSATGETFTLSEALKTHELVAIDLFATWCPHCLNDFPYLEEAWKESKDRVAVVALSCAPTDTDEKLKSIVDELGLTFLVGREEGTGLKRFVTVGYPTMLLIDRSGRVVCTRVGGMGSAKGFVDLFAKYLSEN